MTRRHLARLTLLGLLSLGLATPAQAASITLETTVSFGDGPVGDLGTYHTTIGGITLDGVGFGTSTLYRFNNPNETCGGGCEGHYDVGIGIRSEGQAENPAEPELNVGEFLRLTRPVDQYWSDLSFASVNNRAQFSIYYSAYPAGAHETYRAGQGAFVSATFGTIPVPLAQQATPYIWIVPSGPAADNYLLMSGARLWQTIETLDPPITVAEPAVWGMLSVGLVGLLWQRHRRAQEEEERRER